MPAGSAFCAQCGYGFGPKRTSFWWGSVVGLMVVGGVVGLLFATGNLQLRGGNTAPTITQQGEAPAPVVQKGPKQMPDDVRAWLEHLERIEKKRVALAQKQLAQVLVMGTQIKGAGIADVLGGMLNDEGGEVQKPPELEKAEATVADVRKPWAELADEFATVPPPSGCQEVAGNYDQTLRETGATIGDIQDVLTNAMGDPQGAIEKLQGIRGSHMGAIDSAAGKADEGVQKICDAYDTRKWFSIQRDVGTGGPTLTTPNLGGLAP